ncbi:unnamed protein product [Prunus armeniaca]|uniref:Uncharacterized protein n=1 Tax=Prunus armeniaca TaxID=36596 RepID=A0A6J5Y2V3_PRUAR|nr:unnamed protein product [Prunus armeniaca]CAB4319751.1 unnamed protein product [Prunus armeniaca]
MVYVNSKEILSFQHLMQSKSSTLEKVKPHIDIQGKERPRCDLREGVCSSRIVDECSESTPREGIILHSMNKEKKKKIGQTTFQVILTGEKYRQKVERNESGQPIGEVSVRFSTTLGIIVRECVLKNQAWTLLMVI